MTKRDIALLFFTSTLNKDKEHRNYYVYYKLSEFLSKKHVYKLIIYHKLILSLYPI